MLDNIIFRNHILHIYIRDFINTYRCIIFFGIYFSVDANSPVLKPFLNKLYLMKVGF